MKERIKSQTFQHYLKVEYGLPLTFVQACGRLNSGRSDAGHDDDEEKKEP